MENKPPEMSGWSAGNPRSFQTAAGAGLKPSEIKSNSIKPNQTKKTPPCNLAGSFPVEFSGRTHPHPGRIRFPAFAMIRTCGLPIWKREIPGRSARSSSDQIKVNQTISN
jgi:hypothetical protein